MVCVWGFFGCLFLLVCLGVGIFLFCLFWFSLFFEASGLNRDWAEGVIKRAKWTKHRPVSIFILSKCHSLTLVASNGR